MNPPAVRATLRGIVSRWPCWEHRPCNSASMRCRSAASVRTWPFGVVPPVWHQPGMLLRTMHGVMSSREVFRVEPVRERPAPPLPHHGHAHAADAGGGRRRGGSVLRRAGRGAAARAGSRRAPQLRAPNAGPTPSPPATAAGRSTAPPTGRSTCSRRCAATSRWTPPCASRPRTPAARSSRPALPLMIAEFTPDADGVCEAAVEEFITTAPRRAPERAFDECLREVEAEWKAWLKRTPAMPGALPAGGGAGHVRELVGRRPSGRLRAPPDHADEQELDEPVLELGPLLQRHRPQLPRPRPGVGPAHDALRPPGRARLPCPTPSAPPAPRGTSASRPSTAGRSAR